MDLQSVRAETAARLPAEVPPLLLTFYGMASQQVGNVVVIGDDYGAKLHLDLITGRIDAVAEAGDLPTRFMNSSIAQLAGCLAEYERAATQRPQAATDEARLALIDTLRLQFAAIDPAALADPENWWATILEQQEDELL